MGKKKPSKMNRTLYVDADLDTQMKKCGDVNWSAVASAAFERELSARKDGEKMSGVISRLKAQKAELDAEGFDLGRQDGRDFVTREPIGNPKGLNRSPATLEELRRVDRYVRSHDMEDAALTASTAAGVISGEQGDAADFWAHATDTELETVDDAEYLRGFLAGMKEVYDQVKDQL